MRHTLVERLRTSRLRREMRAFRLLEPRSVDDALIALDEEPIARPIAGGTALLIRIKQGEPPVECLVNLMKIPGLAEIGYDGNGLRIGALATIRAVEAHPLVHERFPLLAEACHAVGNVRIRNLATIGGNLAHADYRSDPPPALIALGAHIELTGRNGVRRVALSDFLTGVHSTLLTRGEIVTAVLVPAMESAGLQTSYLKFTARSNEDGPAAGVAAIVRLVGGRMEEVVLVIGAVTATPTRLSGVEDLLRGRTPDARLLAEAGAFAERSIEPIDDLRGSAPYKRRVAGALVERALRACAAMR